jgi:hypothetical protein
MPRIKKKNIVSNKKKSTKDSNEKEIEKKGFVYYGLKYCFWIMIFFEFFYFLRISGPKMLMDIIVLISTAAIIITFITSILTLKKNKKNHFAIIALILSSLMLAYVMIWVMIGFFEGWMSV